MKIIHVLILAVLMTVTVRAVELQTLEHQVVRDERTFSRAETDLRYCVWTADQVGATKLLKEFGFDVPNFKLKNDQVLAVFMTDNITQDLTQIVHNKTANATFADYADSGIMFKLRAPDAGKKYSHVTAVVFTPVGMPSHLGMRGMIQDGLSEKQ